MSQATKVRSWLISRVDRIAPTLAALLRRLKAAGDDLGLARAATGLRESHLALSARVEQLEAEIDEIRRDNVRLVELTDVVERQLAQPSQSAGRRASRP